MWKKILIVFGVLIVIPLIQAQVGPTVFTPRLTVSPGPLLVTTGNTTVQDLIVQGTCTGCGGVPGGSNTQLQYNDNGAFGGITGFQYDENNDDLSIQITGDITLNPGLGINLTGNDIINIAPGNNAINIASVASGNDVSIGLNPLGAGNISINTANAGSNIAINTAAGGGSTTTAAQFDDNATAAETRFLLWDNDNATLERVTVGAPNSGGAGFKLLRVPN